MAINSRKAAQKDAPEVSRAPDPLRIIVEFETPPDIVAATMSIAESLQRQVEVAPLMEAHGIETGPQDALARFLAVTLTEVPRNIPEAEAFDIAADIAEATGARSAEPELSTDFFPEPQERTGTESGVIIPGCEEPSENDPTAQKPRWALDMIRAPQAWDRQPMQNGRKKGTGIRIFQPDTGIAEHEELEADMIDISGSWDFVENKPGALDPMDYPGNAGHGTATASVVASRAAGKLQGVAPAAKLTPVRAIKSVVVMFHHGQVAAAIEHARQQGADVITMSLGGSWSTAVRAAIGAAIKDGVIVLAAAGNCVGAVVWPARYEEVIAVAGCMPDETPWIGSCRGTEVDITAPGGFVPRANCSPGHGGGKDVIGGGQGTSFAVALTAGVAALWLAHGARSRSDGGAGPKTQKEFARAIRATARLVPGLPPAKFGPGIVDADRLLAADGAPEAMISEMRPYEPPAGPALGSLRSLLAGSGAMESSDELLAATARMEETELAQHAAELSHNILRMRRNALSLSTAEGSTETRSASSRRQAYSDRLLGAVEKHREALDPSESSGLAPAVAGTQAAEFYDIAAGRIVRDGLEWLRALSSEAGGLETGFLPPRDISARAFDMIVGFEVTSKSFYEARYRRPIWPGLNSGVTIGIGYDVGYADKKQLWEDWSGAIPDQMIAVLEQALHVTGIAAKPLAAALRDKVDVPWGPALAVHRGKVLPRWIGIVERALPNTLLINSDQLGALVSLSYNRGANFEKPGDRYIEMRAIKAHMAGRNFQNIPAEIEAMVRLWPDTPGLVSRRLAEAKLFRQENA